MCTGNFWVHWVLKKKKISDFRSTFQNSSFARLWAVTIQPVTWELLEAETLHYHFTLPVLPSSVMPGLVHIGSNSAGNSWVETSKKKQQQQQQKTL